MISIAAVGDIHFAEDSRGLLRPHLDRLPDRADLLLLAGDLTRGGELAEGEVLAEELARVEVPVVAVLGNHDYHRDEEKHIAAALEDAGVRVLEGESVVLETPGGAVGIAGAKGFGGGFAGACGTDYGEPEMKAFIRHTKAAADRLRDVLSELPDDLPRIALLHYSPIKATLVGEKLEIYPFLGSYLLAEAVDDTGADVVFHGHAHGGTEKGITPGGIHVRNVAQPLIKHVYNLYCIRPGEGVA